MSLGSRLLGHPWHQFHGLRKSRTVVFSVPLLKIGVHYINMTHSSAKHKSKQICTIHAKAQQGPCFPYQRKGFPEVMEFDLYLKEQVTNKGVIKNRFVCVCVCTLNNRLYNILHRRFWTLKCPLVPHKHPSNKPIWPIVQASSVLRSKGFCWIIH